MSKSNRPDSPEYSSEDLLDSFRDDLQDRLRASVLEGVYRLFEEEVEKLCGKPYSKHLPGTPRRAGSDKGSVYLDGQKVSVKKPRVKQNGKEIKLKSYEFLQDKEGLVRHIRESVLSGVSMRNYSKLQEASHGTKQLSASSVSQHFKIASQKDLNQLNSRDLSSDNYVVLMIDGTFIAKRAVVSVMGITMEGKKKILGVRGGDSENTEVVSDLFCSLEERGLQHKPFLFVIDGSQALRKAITSHFGGNTFVQRCAVHKERNIKGYLPKSYHSEFSRRWKMLHGCVDYQQAQKSYESLSQWLSRINYGASKSLDESQKETLTVIRLKTSPTLRSTLYSTNPIENGYSLVRSAIKRVKRWRKNSDQAERWTGSVLLRAEEKFKTIRGYRDLPSLSEQIEKLSECW